MLNKSLRRHHGSKPASNYLTTTGEQMRITTNRFRAVLSRLASYMAHLVSKNGRFGDFSSTIVLKVQHDRRCVN